VSYGNYWCTEFAFLWVYDHYGYDYAKQLVGAGEGKDMAANLILNHSAYYQAGSTPAAGAIVSVSGGESPNHVLVIEKVEGDKIWVSDGHVKTYGIRVGIEWNRADFERHYGGPEHVTYANPVQH
jgi:surface antigen